MERTDLAAFRAEHPSVAAAIQGCDRPDWALRLAFEATDNRKAVIRYGANIIDSLKGGGNLALDLVRPYPNALEAIDVYADNDARVSKVIAHGRALILGTCLAGPIAYLVERHGWPDISFQRAFFLLVPLLTLLIRGAMALLVRWRAARLDDDSAFAVVLRRVVRAADKHPMNVPNTMRFLRRNLLRLVDGSQP